MRSRLAACLTVVLTSALAGCGTFVNCAGWNGPAGREIYGGVKQDVQNGAGHLSEAFHGPAPSFSPYPEKPETGNRYLAKTFCAGCGVGMLAVDMPISAVADTLTLPITVTATLMKKPKKTKQKRSSKSIKARVVTPDKAPAGR